MKWALMVVSDGRDGFLRQTLFSAILNLPQPDYLIHVDDRQHILGFAGAIQHGWDQALETDADYIFHLEGDFTFKHPVPLLSMAELAADPHVAQVALKRQPWNEIEHRAGGIVEADPSSFEEGQRDGATYTAHRKFFTTNPSIYRRDIAERGWPQCAESEGHFGLSLFEDPAVVSTFWGGKFDPPRVEHIGVSREGHGY